MQINGTYWDRLKKKILPITTIGIFPCVFLFPKKWLFLIAAFFGATLLFWAMDWMTIRLRYKKFKTLSIEDGIFRFDDIIIKPEDIEQIQPIEMMWSPAMAVEILNFYLLNGQCLKVLDKPVNFFKVTSKEPSKTVVIIINEFPQLKDKLQKTKELSAWRGKG